MKYLIQARKDLQLDLAETDAAIKKEFFALDFEGKLKAFRELGSDFMGEESDFTGSSVGGGQVSLYDDFHWDRHQTKTLEDIYEYVRDYYEGADEDFDEYVKNSDDSRARTFRAMLNACIGSAIYDW